MKNGMEQAVGTERVPNAWMVRYKNKKTKRIAELSFDSFAKGEVRAKALSSEHNEALLADIYDDGNVPLVGKVRRFISGTKVSETHRGWSPIVPTEQVEREQSEMEQIEKPAEVVEVVNKKVDTQPVSGKKPAASKAVVKNAAKEVKAVESKAKGLVSKPDLRKGEKVLAVTGEGTENSAAKLAKAKRPAMLSGELKREREFKRESEVKQAPDKVAPAKEREQVLKNLQFREGTLLAKAGEVLCANLGVGVTSAALVAAVYGKGAGSDALVGRVVEGIDTKAKKYGVNVKMNVFWRGGDKIYRLEKTS